MGTVTMLAVFPIIFTSARNIGQCPIKASPTADRLLSKVIDYLQSRPEVDKTRIAFHGVSWGAYWGTKMAVV
jgi:esterase FrsA